MSKKKLTFSLNYRKPKSQYKDSDELMICIRYYHKCSNTDKTKIFNFLDPCFRTRFGKEKHS